MDVKLFLLMPSHEHIVCHICDVRVNYCLRSNNTNVNVSTLTFQKYEAYTCRCLIHRYGKIFFVWLVVLNGIVWELFRQIGEFWYFVFTTGFLKSLMTLDETFDKYGLLKCLFLMISGTIWYARPYLTLFSNSHIFECP